MAIATGASQEIEDEAGQHWRERAAHMRALSLMMSDVRAQRAQSVPKRSYVAKVHAAIRDPRG